MVVWTHLFLFCVTPDANWSILIIFGFWGIVVLRTFYLAFFLCMSSWGTVGLKTTSSKKTLMVVNVFSDFLAWTSL